MNYENDIDRLCNTFDTGKHDLFREALLDAQQVHTLGSISEETQFASLSKTDSHITILQGLPYWHLPMG